MLSIILARRFKKDAELLKKRGYKIEKLDKTVQLLRESGELPLYPYRPHKFERRLGKPLGMSYRSGLADDICY